MKRNSPQSALVTILNKDVMTPAMFAKARKELHALLEVAKAACDCNQWNNQVRGLSSPSLPSINGAEAFETLDKALARIELVRLNP